MAKLDKKTTQFVKKLVQLSLKDGTVDAGAVEQVLGYVSKAELTQKLPILRAYKRAIQIEIDAGTAKVFSASKLDSASLSKLQQSLEETVGRKLTIETSIDPSLIAGTRVRVGDMVFDYSVQGFLKQLSIN